MLKAKKECKSVLNVEKVFFVYPMLFVLFAMQYNLLNVVQNAITLFRGM